MRPYHQQALGTWTHRIDGFSPDGSLIRSSRTAAFVWRTIARQFLRHFAAARCGMVQRKNLWLR